MRASAFDDEQHAELLRALLDWKVLFFVDQDLDQGQQRRLFTDHIIGVSPEESRELLALIYHQIARPEYHVRFTWSPGAVAFWDTRAAQHYAVSDYYPRRRVMDRISIEGEPLKSA